MNTIAQTSYRCVATLLVVPEIMAYQMSEDFRKSSEIYNLIAVKPHELKSPFKLIKYKKLQQARQINADAKIQIGYLLKDLLLKRPNIYNILDYLCNPPTDDTPAYSLLCQVECPNIHIPQYINIDIGVSSHGKKEIGETLVDCALRETNEEAQLRLPKKIYDSKLQQIKRKQLHVNELPLYVAHGGTFCYIIVL